MIHEDRTKINKKINKKINPFTIPTDPRIYISTDFFTDSRNMGSSLTELYILGFSRH